MSLEKALEANTAAVTRLADLMERFKPNAATPKADKTLTVDEAVKAAKVEIDKIGKPAPKKKAPVKKAEAPEVKETPKAEAPKEEPKPEAVEEPKKVELVDLQKVASILIKAGGDARTQAKAAIEEVAGKGAKIATLDKALYADVLAALEAVQANLEEV